MAGADRVNERRNHLKNGVFVSYIGVMLVDMDQIWITVGKALIAGLLASVACGLGVLPLFVRGLDPIKHRGLGYAFAGGLMFAASVYNLILPGLQMQAYNKLNPDGLLGDAIMNFNHVWPVLLGIMAGAGFLAVTDRYLHRNENEGDLNHRLHDDASYVGWGGRLGMLVFIAMTIHSIPEGVAVGVGYTSDDTGVLDQAGHALMDGNLGNYLALAIAIHNMPEGLAVAIPMRAAGASLPRCFAAAFLTSLPQPLAAVPAVLLAWFFQPLMPILMGFAAGAMIFLILLELIPEALEIESPQRIAWAFTLGFSMMLLVQVLL